MKNNQQCPLPSIGNFLDKCLLTYHLYLNPHLHCKGQVSFWEKRCQNLHLKNNITQKVMLHNV